MSSTIATLSCETDVDSNYHLCQRTVHHTRYKQTFLALLLYLIRQIKQGPNSTHPTIVSPDE